MEIIELIRQYLVDQALILVPALLIVGTVLKSTPRLSDWVIPWILMGLGILGGLAVASFSADGAIQGILASGLAVLGYQLYHQTQTKA